MKRAGVAILGLGVVGSGTYKILTEHREFYQKTQNVDITVESVLVRDRQRALDLGVPEENIAASIAEVIANPNVDIVVECIGGVEAARDHVMAALHEGKSVVTSNKELICKYSHELERTARRNCCGLYFEASCVGGVPVIRTLLDGVQGNRVTEMMGIINGTTNYILTQMAEKEEEYGAALAEAQRLGYAEADPVNDVEGIDAAYKLAILSSLAFHTKVPVRKSVSRGDFLGDKSGYCVRKTAGIYPETSGDREKYRTGRRSARASHVYLRFASSRQRGEFLQRRLPERGRRGRHHAVRTGRGRIAYGQCGCQRYYFCRDAFGHPVFHPSGIRPGQTGRPNLFPILQALIIFAFRRRTSRAFSPKCRGIFAKYGISIVELVQKKGDGEPDGFIPVVLVTHETTENSIRGAVNKINASGIAQVKALIRVER